MVGLALRSALFNLLFFGWSALLAVLFGPLLPLLSHARVLWLGRLWARTILGLLGRIIGLGHEVRGWDNVPRGPKILAVKHQSAWDTVVFLLLLDDPAYVIKRELLRIPLFGGYLRRVGMIAVDRRGGARALRALVRDSEAALAAGRPVVIFPEGTRVAPGERRPYHPGIAALYLRTGAAVVPVALNSGRFWGRRSFLKRPGRIVLEFLPPIEPGLGRKAFGQELERRIETACQRLDDGE